LDGRVFRTWRTLDGGVLVEGPRGAAEVNSYRILTPAGAPVPDPHEYFLLDAAGRLHHHYAELASAHEDDLFGQTYQVVGAELRTNYSIISAVPWRIRPDGTVPREDREEVTLAGLVEVAATDVLGADPAAALDRAWADYVQRRRAAREREEEPFRVACAGLGAALDGYDVDGPVELTFAYRDGLEIRDAAGTVVWRPARQPAVRGKDLHYRLEQLLRQRYGDRAGRLRVDLGDAPWWFWAPDE
jgi:hypothetical protein